METRSTDTGIWTRVSEDGKHAAAGMSLGSGGGMKIGAGKRPQPFGCDGRYGETGGGSSTGPEYRGTVRLPGEVRREVTPPKPAPYPPPPPAPRQPHLTYRQQSGALRNTDGGLMDRGHSGYGEYRDKPEFEDKKNLGVIPRGNYKVTRVVEETAGTDHAGMGQHILRLEPADKETRARLEAMHRDGFWIHRRTLPTASKGCILLSDETRRRIGLGSLLRVTL